MRGVRRVRWVGWVGWEGSAGGGCDRGAWEVKSGALQDRICNHSVFH